MEADVIIPCWIVDKGLLSLTKRAISTLRDTADVNLIIIDNGSTMGVEYLEEQANVYIRNNKNLGYVKAVNQGFQRATNNYIVVANNDIMFLEGWLEPLAEVLDLVPDCRVILPCINQERLGQDGLKEEDLLGSCFMIKQSTLDEIGLLDEQFINRCSDADYAYRLWEKMYSICSTPESRCYHNECSSLRRLIKHEDDKEQYKDNLKYILKWRDHPRFGPMLRETLGNELVNRL